MTKADGEMTPPSHSPVSPANQTLADYLLHSPLLFAPTPLISNILRLAGGGESRLIFDIHPNEVRRNRPDTISYYEYTRHCTVLLTHKPWLYRLPPIHRFSPASTSGLTIDFQAYQIRKAYLWPPEQARAASDWIFEQASAPTDLSLPTHSAVTTLGGTVPSLGSSAVNAGSHVFNPDVTNSDAAATGSQSRGLRGIRVPRATK